MASSSRIDGRAASELRPISLTLGELDRVDGSGRFAFGVCADAADLAGTSLGADLYPYG